MNKNTKIEPRYLKCGAASSYLGVSRRYLSLLARQGRIRAAKIGTRTILFAKADLDAFFNRNAAGGVE